MTRFFKDFILQEQDYDLKGLTLFSLLAEVGKLQPGCYLVNWAPGAED